MTKLSDKQLEPASPRSWRHPEMRTGDLAPFGSEGGVVEVDETFIVHKKGVETPRGGFAHKMPR